MAPSFSLDDVVRRVPSAVQPEEHERLVTIAAKSRRAVPRRGLWGKYRRYLVRNNRDPRHEARGELERLVLRDLDHEVAVTVALQVSCPADHEARVAEALFDLSASPAEVLRRHVERLLGEMCRRGGVAAFVHRCFGDRAGLEAELAEAVSGDTGMHARLHLALPAEASLGPIHVNLPELRVQVRDYEEEQEMAFEATLEVDERSRTAAVLFSARNGELIQWVREEVRRHVRQSLTLQAFSTTLDTDAARGALAAHLDAALAGAGRRARSLELRGRASAGASALLPYEVSVRCRVHEFPADIFIKNSVMLLLRDAARYRRAASPPLREWLQEKLDAAIPLLLFDTRYIDLLIGFEPIKQAIKETLRVEAEAIGHEIKQFITGPDLPDVRLREPFEIDTVGAFETALRGVEVKLQVVVSARIPDLKRIEGFLNRRQDVKRLMEEAIHTELRRELHGMDPERIYMRFTHADPARHPGEQPVQEELRELVRARLADREFHADVISVNVKIVETRLIERFNQLQGSICPFEVEVASFHGGSPVVFRGEFRVINVHPDGWHNFQLLDADLAAIRRHLQTHLLTRLQTLHSEELSYRKDDKRVILEALVTAAATRYVADAFGLSIEVTNVHRDLTGIEEATSANEQADSVARLHVDIALREHWVQAAKDDNAAKLEQLATLREWRGRVIGIEGPKEELELIDTRIAELTESLAEVYVPSHDRLRVDVLGAAPRPLTLPEQPAEPVGAADADGMPAADG